MFLPMINMNPNDITCDYSRLNYIQDHAHGHDQSCQPPVCILRILAMFLAAFLRTIEFLAQYMNFWSSCAVHVRASAVYM